MSAPVFDDLTDVYEAMIDWPKRLEHEGAFYRGLCERIEARTVVDVACGTGRHADLLHGWGLHVEGADLSPRMIARARETFGEPEGLRWAVRGFDRPIAGGPFDAAVCVGNSLALAPDAATAGRAVGAMLAAVRAGGLVVVHVLNLWRLPDGPCVWQKCKRTTIRGEDVLVVKGVHRCGARGYVDLVVTRLEGEPRMQAECVPFLGIEAAELERMAREAGADDVRFFGGYREEPYDRAQSVDLVMVAGRSRAPTAPTAPA